MRSYHLILADSSERDVRAEEIRITDSGALLFLNGTETIVAYSPEAWHMVEVERMDDKE